MKKLLIGLISVAVLIGAVAVPTFAAGGGYGSQPGYDQASDCGAGHGAFGYFNGDTNLGVKSLGPGTPTYRGAVGQEVGATGYNNSTLCGNPQN